MRPGSAMKRAETGPGGRKWNQCAAKLSNRYRHRHVPWELAMSIVEIRQILLWCVGINYAILVVWFGAFIVAHDGLYRLHSHWFSMSKETFDMLHYAGMALFKIAIMVFNLVPLLALYLSSPSSA
jgi:hypothetical protein